MEVFYDGMMSIETFRPELAESFECVIQEAYCTTGVIQDDEHSEFHIIPAERFWYEKLINSKIILIIRISSHDTHYFVYKLNLREGRLNSSTCPFLINTNR